VNALQVQKAMKMKMGCRFVCHVKVGLEHKTNFLSDIFCRRVKLVSKKEKVIAIIGGLMILGLFLF